jgi:hypothetical protein
MRGKSNIANRPLIGVAAFYLGLILRQLLRASTAGRRRSCLLRFVCAFCASCTRQTAVHWLLDPAGL